MEYETTHRMLDLQELHDRLKYARNEPLANRTPYGICRYVGVHRFRLIPYFRKWPEFSGYDDYPVPGYDGLTPKLAYDTTLDTAVFWSPEHPYGAARLRLLDWLIASVEEDLREEEPA